MSISKKTSYAKAALITILLTTITGCSSININCDNAGGSNKTSMNLKRQTVDETKNEKIDNINEISIDATISSINVIPEKRSDVKAHVYGDFSSNASLEFKTQISGEKLNIYERFTNNYSINIRNIDLKLDIYVPQDYSKNLTIESSSGDISIKDIANLDKVVIKTKSGDMNIYNLKAASLEAYATSGSFGGKDITVETASINASSGDINIENLNGDLSGVVSSGDISVANPEFNHDMDLTASSGDAEVTIPKSSEFYIDAAASSGEITCEFPAVVEGKSHGNTLRGVVGNPKNKINIKTSSGDIYIRSK
ncbi:MAG TPA: hypothetical protein DEF85_11015 [Clostridiaceae bacterium]|mgnify:CR=1 FL=1|jgi:lia operon protein LiaG|nr:hypothetical protein [Clostridiaceae bacterium]HBF77955.1 hypothetical protein [Clostridiaceae bacterium]HBG38315.1 hypothetical protein [Clostridiaceae bacterium]HBN28539.1 hypothetical protein [Clostridiaceae bacterium]HBX49406.1 hypothetical protein [Clostridiaceae bacterium]